MEERVKELEENVEVIGKCLEKMLMAMEHTVTMIQELEGRVIVLESLNRLD